MFCIGLVAAAAKILGVSQWLAEAAISIEQRRWVQITPDHPYSAGQLAGRQFPCPSLEDDRFHRPIVALIIGPVGGSQQSCEAFTRDCDDIAAVVRQMCEVGFNDGPPSLEDVARRMGLLPRTLQRRLRERGTSFRQIRQDVVMSHAQALLCKSDLPIRKIAAQLGYTNSSQFCRAFKAWTGVTPHSARGWSEG